MASSGCKLRVYAVNYNVLRIMAGMGGLCNKVLKVSLETNLLVKFLITLQHYQTAGNSLESKLPLCLWKHYKGPRLIAVRDLRRRCTICCFNNSWASPNGKNVWNWTIRSQAPKIVMIMVKVQRLNVSGGNNKFPLRYSLVPWGLLVTRKPLKYTERWGIHVLIPTKLLKKQQKQNEYNSLYQQRHNEELL